MSIDTNTQSSPDTAGTPAIRSFEFDDTAVGNIKTSVNQYRGTLSLPIDLLKLDGRANLDVSISAAYSSSIARDVNAWNVDKATGTLGLGWDMPFEKIVMEPAGNGSPSSDRYYLVAGGASTPMMRLGTTAHGLWIFELKQYQFWDITYDPTQRIWRIIKENGSISSYGAETPRANAVQWGVHWGNWMGSSSRVDGQEQYARVFNLASIQSVLGDRVTYDYMSIDVPVGETYGKTYTQASYVSQITDSLGRVVQFHYEDKFGAQNPSAQNIVEYQARNAEVPAPNAYQDIYETKYLDRIEVSNAEGRQIHGLTFTYDFVNFAASTDPDRNLKYKRILSSVFQWSPEGRVLPSMSFTYNTSTSDTNPGALTKIKYPGGGEATVAYKELILDSPRRAELKNPFGNGRPAVWHGDDYILTTFTGATGFQCQVSSNNGRWVTFDATPNALASATIDPDSLWAYADGDYFAISGRETVGNRDFLCLFRKSQSAYGDWDLDPQGVRWLTVKSGSDTKSTFIAGRDFVIAANIDYTSQIFRGFSWEWQNQGWFTPPVMPSESAARSNGNFAIAAFDNAYACAIYDDAGHRINYQMFFRDAMLAWNDGGRWTTSNTAIHVENGKPSFGVALQTNYLATTYATAFTQTNVDYSIAVHQLDEQFAAINGPQPRVVSETAPVENGKALYNVFQTIPSQNAVTNTLLNLRNEGGDQRASTNYNWSDKTLTLGAGNTPVVAAQTDVTAYIQTTPTNTSTVELWKFDPNQPGSQAWASERSIVQTGTSATVFGTYLTIGDTVYFDRFDGSWRALTTTLTGLGPQGSVQNRAPNYIAYQDGDTAQARSYVVATQNGDIGVPTVLPGGPSKIWVPQDQAIPGSNLAGLRFLVSYPSGDDFTSASTLSLYNLDQGSLADFSVDTPVAWTAIEDPFDATQRFVQSYIYGNSTDSIVAYDTQSGLAQYPNVNVVTGAEVSQNALPQAQPFGRTEFFYSNGVSPQTTLSYPTGWIYNYANVLNGVELAKRDYDAAGTLVADQLNYWKIFEAGPKSQQLFGSYARAMRTRTTRDGVTVDSYSDYASTSGLEASRRQSYFDSKGQKKWLREEITFAYQIPTYSAVFNATHYLGATAQHDRCVVDDSSGDKTYIESKVTTWKDWAGGAGAPQLAKEQSLQWTVDGPTPIYDFTATLNAGWVADAIIKSRTKDSALITEQIDIRDAASSFIYDKDSRYLVATFPGASIAAGQASYWAMEPYEDTDGWTVGRNAEIIPQASGDTIDAHTGTHAVLINPGAPLQKCLSRSWIAEGTGAYVFAAWVKRPKGYDTSLGIAAINITVNGLPAAKVAFSGDVGKWVYQAIEFELTAAKSAIVIDFENPNSESHVLVDNLCVAPKHCTWAATSFNTRLWLPDARLEANGVTARMRFDAFGRVTMRTNSVDSLSEISSPYQSRDGNNGNFTATDPDAVSILRPSTKGTLDTFDRGTEWQANWTEGTAGQWDMAQGILTNSGSAARASLTSITADPAAGFALGVQLKPQGPAVMAMGIQIGTDVTIAWDPDTGIWTLTGPGVGAKATVAYTTYDTALQTEMPEDEYATTGALPRGSLLGKIKDRFARRGIHVPHHAQLIQNTVCNSHEINIPESHYRIVMRTTNGVLTAQRIGGLWALYVHKKTLVFRIDGKVIFSKTFDRAITGTASLFFDSSVAISDLAVGSSPAAAVNYTDTTGNQLQQQAIENGQMSVSQVLTDVQGRPAVQAKPIWVEASVATPLLSYTTDVAPLDWTTGQMSGLVAAAFPADGGFPYTRETYEASPLGRVLKSGLPGADFAVGSNDTSMEYGSNTGLLGLPADSYTRQVSTDANGNPSTTLSTTLGQTILQSSERSTGHVITSTVAFDDAGNPVKQRHPNFYDPPAGSVADDWVITQTFDFAGRPLTKTMGKLGTSQMVYSPAGDLRFMSDPDGQNDGTYLYWKYDSLGRPVESGYLTGVFDRVLLTDKANNDANWPVNLTTWRKRQRWDGGSLSANAIGRLIKVETCQDDAGTASTSETYVYDLFGNATQLLQKLAGTKDLRQTNYVFDMQGAPISVAYPKDVQGKRWKLTYRYDPLRRVTSISEGDGANIELIAYTYQADGRPLSETRPGDGTNPSTRSFEYNPPLWPTRLHDSTARTALFTEGLSYTSGGFQNAGFFDGTIAATDYPDAGGAPEHAFKYGYNKMGEMEHAECPQHPEWSLGGAVPIEYDANGNTQASGMGTRDIRFDYVNQTQRLKKVRDVTDSVDIDVAEFTYNKNGGALTSKTVGTPFAAATDVSFSYDPGIKRPVAAQPKDKDPISYRYGATGARVVKDVDTSSGATPPERTTYSHGVNGVTLYEQTPRDESFYGFGPQGLALVRHNGEVLYILRDHLGSVRRLLDKTNTVVANFDYLPYGTVARSAGPKQDATNMRFTGHPFDEDVGLYDTRARFYSGQLGRFLDIDPMTQFFSPYTYAANNPALYVDPDGQFSFSSLFSAIAGVIIGAVEILIGVALDVVAGVVEALSLGTATAAAIGLAAAAGAFYGAGISSVLYSVMNVQSFEWSEYGIQMGIGAVAGAISFGFGAIGSSLATSAATTVASQAAKTGVTLAVKVGFGVSGGAASGAVSTTLNDVAHNVTPGFDVVTGALWSALSSGVSTGVGGPAYKSGFKQFGKRVLLNVGKKEAIGLSIAVTKNAVNGDPLNKGLVNTAVSGLVWGTVGSIGAQAATKETINDFGAAIAASVTF